jgi:hypothetical protein
MSIRKALNVKSGEQTLEFEKGLLDWLANIAVLYAFNEEA